MPSKNSWLNVLHNAIFTLFTHIENVEFQPLEISRQYNNYKSFVYIHSAYLGNKLFNYIFTFLGLLLYQINRHHSKVHFGHEKYIHHRLEKPNCHKVLYNEWAKSKNL